MATTPEDYGVDVKSVIEFAGLQWAPDIAGAAIRAAFEQLPTPAELPRHLAARALGHTLPEVILDNVKRTA